MENGSPEMISAEESKEGVLSVEPKAGVRRIDEGLYKDILHDTSSRMGWDTSSMTEKEVKKVYDRTKGDVTELYRALMRKAGGDVNTLTQDVMVRNLDKYGVVDKPNKPATKDYIDWTQAAKGQRYFELTEGDVFVPREGLSTERRVEMEKAVDAVDSIYEEEGKLTPAQKLVVAGRWSRLAREEAGKKYGNVSAEVLRKEDARIADRLGLDLTPTGEMKAKRSDEDAYDAYFISERLTEKLGDEVTESKEEVDLNDFYVRARGLNADFEKLKEGEVKKEPGGRTGYFPGVGGMPVQMLMMSDVATGQSDAARLFNDATVSLYERWSDAARSSGTGNVVKGVGEGVGDYAVDSVRMMRDMGKNASVIWLTRKIDEIRSGLPKEMTDREVQERVYEGLTPEDRNLLESYANYVGATEAIGKEMPTTRRVGEGVGESLGFMAEFVLTGGTGWLKGAVKGGSMALLRGGMKAAEKNGMKYAAEIAAKGVERMGRGESMRLFLRPGGKYPSLYKATNKVLNKGVNMVERQAFAIPEAAVQAVFMPSMYRRAGDRMAAGEGAAEALSASWYDVATENWSERLFVGGGKGASLTGSALDLGKRKGLSGLADMVKGTGEEYLEELAGDFVKRMPGWADTDFSRAYADYWNDKADTFYSVGLMTGMLGAAGMAVNGVTTNRKMNEWRAEAMRKNLPSDLADHIDELMDVEDVSSRLGLEAIGSLIRSSALASDVPTGKLAAKVQRYIGAKMRLDGMDVASKKNEPEREKVGEPESFVSRGETGEKNDEFLENNIIFGENISSDEFGRNDKGKGGQVVSRGGENESGNENAGNNNGLSPDGGQYYGAEGDIAGENSRGNDVHELSLRDSRGLYRGSVRKEFDGHYDGGVAGGEVGEDKVEEYDAGRIPGDGREGIGEAWIHRGGSEDGNERIQRRRTEALYRHRAGTNRTGSGNRPLVASLGEESVRGLSDNVYLQSKKTNGQPIYEPLNTRESDVNTFLEATRVAKQNNTYSAFVDIHTPEEYGSMRARILSEDGMSGVAVEEDGNIVNLFSHQARPNGASYTLFLTALENGGIKGDNFDGRLTKLYVQMGAIPVAKVKFDKSHAPVDWNYKRDEVQDVILWMHNGESAAEVARKIGSYEAVDTSTLPVFDSYDEAAAYRDRMLNERLDGANAGETNGKEDAPRGRMPDLTEEDGGRLSEEERTMVDEGELPVRVKRMNERAESGVVSIGESKKMGKRIADAYRKGKGEVADRIKEVRGALNGYRNIGKLTEKQHRDILKALSAPRADVNRILDGIDRMVVDNGFATKAYAAKARQRKQADRIMDRVSVMTLPEWIGHDVVSEFVSLDTDGMDGRMMDGYERIMDDLAGVRPRFSRFIPEFIAEYRDQNRETEVSRKHMEVSLEALDDFTKGIHVEGMPTASDYRKVARELGRARKMAAVLLEDGRISAEEFEGKMVKIGEIEDELKDGDARIRSVMVSRIKDGMIGEAMEAEGVKGTPLEDVLKEVKRFGIGLNGMKSLTAKQLASLERGLFNASIGIPTRDLYEVWSVLKVNEMAGRLDRSRQKIESAYGNRRVRKMLDDAEQLRKKIRLYDFSMLDVLFDVGKGKDLYEHFFVPQIESAVVRMDKEKSSVLKDFSEKVSDLNGYFFTAKGTPVESLLKGRAQRMLDLAGMMMVQLDYEANVKGAFDELTEDKRSYFGYLIGSNGLPSKGDLGSRTKDAYQLMLFDGTGRLDVSATLSGIKDVRLRKRVDALMSSARKLLDGRLRDYNTDNAVRRGMRLKMMERYFPRFVRRDGATRSGEEIEFNDIYDHSRMMPTSVPSSMNDRTGGINAVEIDIARVISRSVNETLTDYHLAPAFAQANSALVKTRDKGGKAAAAFEAMRGAMRDRLVKNYRRELAGEDLAWLKKADRYMARMSRMILLAKVPKVFAEFLSNQAGALISDGAVGWSYWGKIDVLHSFADELNLTSAQNIMKYNEVVRDASGSSQTWGEKGINALITVNDTWTSSAIYYRTFNRLFAEISGEKFDYERAKTDDGYKQWVTEDRDGERSFFERAHIGALTRAQESFTTVNRALGATHTALLFGRGQMDADSFAGRAFGFMMSFNTNENFEFVRGYRETVRGMGAGDSRMVRTGLGRMSSRFVRGAVYAAAMQQIGNLITSGLRDDKEPEVAVDPNLLAGTCIQLALGRYGNSGGILLNFGLGALEYWDKKVNGNARLTREVTDAINNGAGIYAVPMTTGISTQRAISKFFPHWGFMTRIVTDSQDMMFDVYEKKSKGMDLTDDEQMLWGSVSLMNAVLTMMYPNPLTTTGYNVGKTVESSYRKDKKEGRSSGQGRMDSFSREAARRRD